MPTPAVIELHQVLSNALVSFIEPIIRKRAKAPASWRLTLIARNVEPGHEGEWVCCTDDDPAEVARTITGTTGEVLPGFGS